VTAPVSVRPVRPSDAPRWAAMRHALWPDETLAAHAAEIAAFFAGTQAEPQGVLVAEASYLGEAPEAVGFAELSLRAYAEGCETSPVGYLEGWYVVPAWRRRGVGRALMAGAEAWARAQGCRELASDTEAANETSAAAHRTLGFEDMGLIRCFLKKL
jgi:aminoglycoside 6'-N-acetyltransferase I